MYQEGKLLPSVHSQQERFPTIVLEPLIVEIIALGHER
jgi:hypothetical protein